MRVPLFRRELKETMDETFYSLRIYCSALRPGDCKAEKEIRTANRGELTAHIPVSDLFRP